jgi:rare lipoprotein A
MVRALPGLVIGWSDRTVLRFSVTLLWLVAALCFGCTPRSLVAPPSGGWGPSYSVFGRTYHTLLSPDGYVEEGLASWYGHEFHGRSTSSGETYDMHSLTAAHKTLPLHCWVRVCNLANGREVVVRVNDRGPFVDGRVIDLSLAGAKALGMEAEGVVPCRVEALGFRVPGGWRRPESYDAGEFTIQVGAFRDPANARRLQENLRVWGQADISPFERGGATLYRVRVARYRSLAEALRWQEEIRRQGFADAFVVAADQGR